MKRRSIIHGVCIVFVVFACHAARADDPPRHHPMAAGSDFCFTRTDDRAHLTSHPEQTITAMQLMGRNAWRAPPSQGSVYATLHVSFRNGKPLLMNGRCLIGKNAENAASDGQLRCKFFLDSMQDMLAQSATLSWPSNDNLLAEFKSDWKQLRRREEPKNAQRPAATEDTKFLLARSAVTSCTFPNDLWTASGPTEKLIGTLP